MRFAYGFKRQQSDFSDVQYEDIYLDTGRQREQLADMLAEHIRTGAGDEIVILDEKDIPEQGPFRDAIAAKGAKIVVVGLEPAPRGAPSSC